MIHCHFVMFSFPKRRVNHRFLVFYQGRPQRIFSFFFLVFGGNGSPVSSVVQVGSYLWGLANSVSNLGYFCLSPLPWRVSPRHTWIAALKSFQNRALLNSQLRTQGPRVAKSNTGARQLTQTNTPGQGKTGTCGTHTPSKGVADMEEHGTCVARCSSLFKTT